MSKTVAPRVCCKKALLKIFTTFTRKNLYWSLFLIWDYRDSSTGVFLWILQNFKNTYFCRAYRNCCFWNVTWLVSWKSLWVILGETVQSSHSHKINKKRPVPESLFLKTLVQVFSCEFCQISKKDIFYRTPPCDCFWIFSQVLLPFLHFFKKQVFLCNKMKFVRRW